VRTGRNAERSQGELTQLETLDYRQKDSYRLACACNNKPAYVGKEDYMKVACIVFTIILFAIGIVYIVNEIKLTYRYEREIFSYWSLADKSSTLSEKAQYVGQFVKALEKSIKKGVYNAVVFPTMDNSFDYNLKALKSLSARLNEIQTMNKKSFEYQTALEQITKQEQGEAEAMLSVFKGCWQLDNYPRHWDWYAVLWIFGWLIIFVLCIVGTCIDWDY